MSGETPTRETSDPTAVSVHSHDEAAATSNNPPSDKNGETSPVDSSAEHETGQKSECPSQIIDDGEQETPLLDRPSTSTSTCLNGFESLFDPRLPQTCHHTQPYSWPDGVNDWTLSPVHYPFDLSTAVDAYNFHSSNPGCKVCFLDSLLRYSNPVLFPAPLFNSDSELLGLEEPGPGSANDPTWDDAPDSSQPS